MQLQGSNLRVQLNCAFEEFLKDDLHGTTLSHVTSLRHAYDMNCFV